MTRVGIIATMAAALLTACHSGRSAATGAPSLSEITAALTAHARALTGHDRAAFDRGVDNTAAAAGFRQRQDDTFTALSTVPLGQWSYTVAAPVTDATATAAATARLHAAARLVHLTFAYAFSGIDVVPSTHDVWWTFIRQDGRVVAAGDTDMATAGGVSWRAPWEYGPQDVHVGTGGVVFVPTASALLLPVISSAADEAVAAVARAVPVGWPKRVVVILPVDRAEVTALATREPTIGDVSAEVISDQQDPLSEEMPGIRILLDPVAFTALSAVGRALVLRHEITHAALVDNTGYASPRWLVEGTAEYVANLTSGISVPVAAAELRAEVQAGRVPAALPTDAQLTGTTLTPQQVAAAYEASWLACRLIASKVGTAGLLQFYRTVGGTDDTPAGALESALQSVLHLSTAVFTAQWRRYLVEQVQ